MIRPAASAVTLCLLLALASCGVRGDPVPPPAPAPERVAPAAG